MRRHPPFDELDESLAAWLPHASVECAGQWRQSKRRAYREGSQSGTGSGPFVDVIDARWQGSLTSAEPIVGLAFAPTELSWAKTTSAGAALEIVVSLSAYANYSPQRATFSARVAHAGLPGVAVASSLDLRTVCTIRKTSVTTARVEPLADTAEASFAVMLLPRRYVTFGRHRLWRLRGEYAASLPGPVREILTRGRNGSMAWTTATTATSRLTGG